MHTHAELSWKQLYELQRYGSPAVENLPRTPRLGLADGPIAKYAGDWYKIHIGCEDPRCQRTVGFWPQELLDLLGETATFSDVERRFRCKECGRLIGGVRIVWHGQSI